MCFVYLKQYDSYPAFFLLFFTILLILVYSLKSLFGQRSHFDRVDKDGGSILLGKFLMEVSHFALTPVGNLFAALSISPNMITFFSIFLALVAAVFLSQGLFGFGGLIAVVASLLDLVDGLVARKTGTMSIFGKILDSTADRISEFLLFSGILFYYKRNPYIFIIVSLALMSSLVNSYISSLEREVLSKPIRSFMRRPERVAYLLSGALLSALVNKYDSIVLPASYHGLPLLIAVSIIAILTTIALVSRLIRLSRL